MAKTFAIQWLKALNSSYAVKCNFRPLYKKGFWFNYCIKEKLIWAKKHRNLSSLFGASTISLRKDVIEEIGIENLFTNKSTTGVDHYMGIMLKKNNKQIGFVKNTLVFTPRPNNIREFVKDRYRWFTAFFQIYTEDKWLLYSTLLLSILDNLFPPLLLFRSYIRMRNIFNSKYSKLKLVFILFIAEYTLNFIRIKAALNKITKKLRFLGHFKGVR